MGGSFFCHSFYFLGRKGCHEFGDSFPGWSGHLPHLSGTGAPGIGAEPNPVREEDLFKGPGFIGLVFRSCKLFPGVPGFDISAPDNQIVAISVNEL